MVVKEITVSVAGLAWVRDVGLYRGACLLGRHLRNHCNGSRATLKGYF